MTVVTKHITRTVVNGGFFAARVPLNLAERALHRGDRGDEWPPTLLLSSVEASVKQIVGSWTGDDALVRAGRLTDEKVNQLRKAGALETISEQREEESEAQLRARVDAAEKRRKGVRSDAARKKQLAEERSRLEAQQAAQRVERESERAAAAAATAEVAATRTERSARAKRVEAERTAVAEQRKAVAAKKRVAKVDDRLEATKRARKAR
jgi:hypothetical protein